MSPIAALSNAVATQHSLSKRQARDILDTIFSELPALVQERETVIIPNFGKFQTRHRPERRLNGPIANNKLVPAHNAVVFKPYTVFKDAVNT